MPLIIVCGKPCTGKTRFATVLCTYLQQHDKKVCLINEESEKITKIKGYCNSSAEKSTRSTLKSRVNEALVTDTFVILDALNYIKGYRYELFCIARTVRTSYCVCWVECPSSKIAAKWNDVRLKETGDGYDSMMSVRYICIISC